MAYKGGSKKAEKVNQVRQKEQFDSIPAYEDGKGKTINKEDLPPEYRTGTPEYFERQRKMSGAVNVVQPEVYITPAKYIKDAINFIEDLGKGDYAGAVIGAAPNPIPWKVGKTIEKIKKKVGRTRKQIINTKELEGVYPLYPVPSYKNGGIHIKKSKRGTFKAAAKKAGMGV